MKRFIEGQHRSQVTLCLNAWTTNGVGIRDACRRCVGLRRDLKLFSQAI